MNTAATFSGRTKLLTASAAFAFVITFGYAPLMGFTVPKAEAQWSTIEAPGPLLAGIAAISGTTGATAGSTFGSFTISNILNGIAWAVAKAAVQSITQSTIRWINSGFQGSPGFVTNLQQTLVSLGDHIAGQFITQLLGSNFLCSPFRLQVSAAVQSAYYKGYFSNSCTLTGIVANVENFTKGTFSAGGWNGWFSMTTQSQGNAYSAYNAAQNELSARIVNGQGQQIKLLDWGKGFMSWCGSDAPASNASTPAAGGSSGATTGSSAIETVTVTPERCLNSDGSTGSIKTPGSVIESQLEQQLGSGVEQLNLANSINEIISALMTQLVKQALGGVTGLLGASSPSSGGGASLVDQLSTDKSATNAIASTTMNSIITASETARQQLVTYQTDWQTIAVAAASAKTAIQNIPAGAVCTFPGGLDASTTVTTTVQPVIDQGTVANTHAMSAIAAYVNVEAEAHSVLAGTSGNTDITQQMQQAGNDYAALNASTTLPSAIDFGYASVQSQPSAGTATTSAPTLFGQMNQLIGDAQSCTGP